MSTRCQSWACESTRTSKQEKDAGPLMGTMRFFSLLPPALSADFFSLSFALSQCRREREQNACPPRLPWRFDHRSRKTVRSSTELVFLNASGQNRGTKARLTSRAKETMVIEKKKKTDVFFFRDAMMKIQTITYVFFFSLFLLLLRRKKPFTISFSRSLCV